MKHLSNLDAWLKYLVTLNNKKIDLGLQRVAKVFALLDIAFKCPIVTISGTNGKGSTCKLLSAMFSSGNYRVACMTSPHLFRFNERACIGTQEITDQELISQFEIIEKTRRTLSPAPLLSFFEFTTLAIINFFFQSKPDLVILEVGMGGRLDAVNILDPDYAVITNIAFDHMAYLGNTLETIAFEKAGIFRKKIPVVLGSIDPPKTLLQYAEFLECPVYLAKKDFDWQIKNGIQKKWNYIGPDENLFDLPVPVLFGENQLVNASMALTIVSLLKDKMFLSRESKESGLQTVKLKGRFQVLSDRPVKILDVAHNPHAARMLAKNLLESGEHVLTHAVFGAFFDKDVFGIVEALRSQVDYWYLTLLDSERSSSLPSLRLALLKAGVDADTICGEFLEPMEAYSQALKYCKKDERILVFGSFLTVSGLYGVI